MNFVANLARRGAGLMPSLNPRVLTEPHFAGAPQTPAEHAQEEAAVVDDGTRIGLSPSASSALFAPRAVDHAHPRKESASFSAPSLLPRVEPEIAFAPPGELSSRSGFKNAARTVTSSESRGEPATPTFETRAATSQTAPEPDINATPHGHLIEPPAMRETRDDAAPDARTPHATSALVVIEPRAQEIFEGDALRARVISSAAESLEAEAPRIQVRIGQIQVRLQKPPLTPRPTAPPRTVRGFDDFARARAYVDRIY
jgi:hypothetical protein